MMFLGLYEFEVHYLVICLVVKFVHEDLFHVKVTVLPSSSPILKAILKFKLILKLCFIGLQR